MDMVEQNLYGSILGEIGEFCQNQFGLLSSIIIVAVKLYFNIFLIDVSFTHENFLPLKLRSLPFVI